jgi:cytosine/adenosine deaminase-related metal-dependent hydrolase
MAGDRILIRNPLLVATMSDHREEFRGGHLLIEGNRITSLGPEPFEVQDAEVIEADGMVVLPGLINTHHHLYQSLTRNIPLMQNLPLFRWLEYHYEVWRELTAEAVRVSAQVGLLELMQSGVTTSADHLYLFPRSAGEELIDAEIQAARTVGIRFHPTRGSMSLGRSHGGLPPDEVVQTEAEIWQDTERLLARYHDDGEGAMVRLALAPCSPFSVTSELMRTTAEFAQANGLQIHTHLAETVDEERYCREHYGMRPLEYVASVGWLIPNSWFAHAVYLNDDEIQRLGEAGAGVTHCPTSNMRLGSGIARVQEMSAAGVAVSLGVDGSASNDSGNLLGEIRQAMLLSRLRAERHWLTAREVLWLATRGGARVLGRDDIGQLTVGKMADVALFSVQSIEYAGGLSDPLAALVFSQRTAPVDYLIVNGKIRIRAGRTELNVGELVQTHNHLSREMMERARQRTGIDFTRREEK